MAEEYLTLRQSDEALNGVASAPADGSNRLKPMFKRLETSLPSDACFDILYGEAPDAYWLDSSSHARQQGRYSFMGDDQGPHSELVSYDVTAGRVEVRSRAGVQTFEESVFDCLDRRMKAIEFIDDHDMPVPFKGGYVGYLGYELKADCGGQNAHRSRTPDSKMIFADRFVAYDHELGDAWMVCLVEPGKEADARDWFEAVEARLAESGFEPGPAPVAPGPVAETEPWVMRHDRDAYLDRIRRSLHEIADGESYEVCLTNEWTRSYEKDPLATYKLPAQHQSSTLFGLPALRRSQRAELLAGAHGASLQGGPGQLQADQGHHRPRQERGRGLRAEGAAADEREGPGREPDDRRPDPQRPQPGLPDRHASPSRTSARSSRSRPSTRWSRRWSASCATARRRDPACDRSSRAAR